MGARVSVPLWKVGETEQGPERNFRLFAATFSLSFRSTHSRSLLSHSRLPDATTFLFRRISLLRGGDTAPEVLVAGLEARRIFLLQGKETRIRNRTRDHATVGQALGRSGERGRGGNYRKKNRSFYLGRSELVVEQSVSVPGWPQVLELRLWRVRRPPLPPVPLLVVGVAALSRVHLVVRDVRTLVVVDGGGGSLLAALLLLRLVRAVVELSVELARVKVRQELGNVKGEFQNYFPDTWKI